ncbi:uncharacterized protein LOC105688555 [Athalia rosae]|uniref:uncharacterized protein LOC105688555 n=1 Tax=Athalia rosae TaxID=37344 RepID=UPI0020337920|nr:uncharacterized protein LOC105688555 [Athalia rosae]XP_048512643.1 uncharacterized protein LOC105688555 [Athalia rosae]
MKFTSAAYIWSLVVILLMKTVASEEDEILRWAYGLRTLLKGCPPAPNSNQHEVVAILRNCLQHRTIVAVDTLLMDDVIPILDGISLVRYEDPQSNGTDKDRDGESANELEDNQSHENDNSWQGVVMNRFTRLFRTHVLKIDVDQLSKNIRPQSTESLNVAENGVNAVQGRRRRRHKRKGMVPMMMMMMGVMFMGAAIIPMGFKFLAVLGGKALILAKLALLLSSIQGLKKIATSGVNYGLYHSPGPEQLWHDRSHQEPARQPVEIPYRSYPPGLSNP